MAKRIKCLVLLPPSHPSPRGEGDASNGFSPLGDTVNGVKITVVPVNITYFLLFVKSTVRLFSSFLRSASLDSPFTVILYFP